MDNSTPTHIPNTKLRKIRVANKLTQPDMAKYIGTSVRTYLYKEKGRWQFKEQEINKILELFDLPYEEIFGTDN